MNININKSLWQFKVLTARIFNIFVTYQKSFRLTKRALSLESSSHHVVDVYFFFAGQACRGSLTGNPGTPAYLGPPTVSR